MLKRTRDFLRQPSSRYSVLTISVVCISACLILWGGFNAAMEASNELEFCISCHEMGDTVYREYKKTRHYSNRIGVRASCSDCHVPRDLSGKILRKMLASSEVWGKITGSVDTTEKFEARRLELATLEWARMKASNSRECRNCHDLDAISRTSDVRPMYGRHIKARDEGKTCIDCHKGVAHYLPRGYVDLDEE